MADRYRNCIGPNIRKLRARMAWTQEVFAGRLQLSGLHHFDRVTVAKIESQIRSVYDYELLVIAKELEVAPQDLFPSPDAFRSDLSKLIGESEN